MTVLTVAGYTADAAIIATYAVTSRTGRVRPFHWANAIGCAPLIAVEVATRAWPPLVLTAMFGAIGWAGLLKEGRNR